MYQWVFYGTRILARMARFPQGARGSKIARFHAVGGGLRLGLVPRPAGALAALEWILSATMCLSLWYSRWNTKMKPPSVRPNTCLLPRVNSIDTRAIRMTHIYSFLIHNTKLRVNGIGRPNPCNSIHRSLAIVSAAERSRSKYMRVSGENRRPRTSGYHFSADLCTVVSTNPPFLCLSCAFLRVLYTHTAKSSLGSTAHQILKRIH